MHRPLEQVKENLLFLKRQPLQQRFHPSELFLVELAKKLSPFVSQLQ